MMLAPRWKHDCDRCLFLGYHDSHGKQYDLYACDHGPGPTVLARYGDETVECKSGLVAAAVDEQLMEAARRAIRYLMVEARGSSGYSGGLDFLEG